MAETPKKPGIVHEFKAFINRGSVVDVAVAFVMGLWLGQQGGGALQGMAWGIGFWSLVTSLTAWTLVQRIGLKRA